jgi:hypothetical protein
MPKRLFLLVLLAELAAFAQSGLAAAIPLTRLMSALRFEIGPLDPAIPTPPFPPRWSWRHCWPRIYRRAKPPGYSLWKHCEPSKRVTPDPAANKIGRAGRASWRRSTRY